jgi:MFS family permease
VTALSESTVRPAGQASRHTAAILAVILVSYFMILLDNSIIFTAVPKIQATMRLSPAGLAWVQDAYTLVFGGLLLGARAGDLLRRRRVCLRALRVRRGPAAGRALTQREQDTATEPVRILARV